MKYYEYQINMLRSAIECLEHGEAGRASWRIADALGRIKMDTTEDLMGVDYPTGLGWQLTMK